jgi:hypothetical protein
MTREEKTEFIEDLIGNVHLSILAKLEQMPPEWDGIELRQYIADKFREVTYRPMDKKRRRDYDNTIAVTTL